MDFRLTLYEAPARASSRPKVLGWFTFEAGSFEAAVSYAYDCYGAPIEVVDRATLRRADGGGNEVVLKGARA